MITTDVLDALLSPDADQRRRAEAYLQAMTVDSRVEALMQTVMVAAQQQQQQHHAQLVAVLLRRDILKLSSISVLQALVDPLLALVVGSSSSSMMQKCRLAVGDCLAEICAMVSILSPQDDDGRVVVGRILEAVGESAARADLTALGLLVRLADRSPASFLAGLGSPEKLGQLVSSALQSTAAPGVLDVLTELVVTTAAAVNKAAESNSQDACSSSTAHAIAKLGSSCWLPLLKPVLDQQQSDVDHLWNILGHWVYAAEIVPSLFVGDSNVFSALGQACLAMAAASGQDEKLALQAVQVLATLCADKDVKRQYLQNGQRQAILQGIVPVCVRVITTNVDNDVETWAADPPTLHDVAGWDEEDELACFAEDLLQSFLHSFAGPEALNVVLPAVEQLLNEADWRTQRAALSVMLCCMEAAPLSFAQHVPVAMEAALSYATSSANFRVQHQAILLLGILCENGPDTVREQYGARMLQALAQGTRSTSNKIAFIACSGIVAYCRPPKLKVDAEAVIVPYLSDILASLASGPLAKAQSDKGEVVVQIRAIGAIACLAEAAGPAFGPFYPQVMPGLLACAQISATGTSFCHELTQLKGAAMESATIVGQAVGDDYRHVFLPTATQMMQWAVPMLSSASHDDVVVAGMPLDQLLAACARIASVMGPDYAPYVDSVLPHLLQRATSASDVEISEGDEAGLEATRRHEVQMNEDDGMQSMTVAVPGKGLTRVTINTTRVQAKAQAVTAIYEHAAAMGAAFGPYAKTCLDSFVQLVRFRFSSEIRATSAQTLAAVFEAACSHGESIGMDLPAMYLSLVTKTIAQQLFEEDSADLEVVHALASAMSEIYFSVYRRLDEHGATFLRKTSVGDANAVVELSMKSLVACLERRAGTSNVLSGAQGPLTADEREEHEDILRGEENLLTPLVDTVGYNLKMFRQEFVPVFETHVVPVLGPYLMTGNDARARLSAVCLFDDCVEFCGTNAAAKFGPLLAQGVVAGLDETKSGHDEDLWRASIYGVAQLARYAPSTVLAPYVQPILTLLLSIATSPSLQEDSPAVFENAVSALASLVLIGSAPFKSSGFVKRDTAVQVFLGNLPLREDEDEAKFCHAGLCDLVEQKSFDLNPETCKQLVRIIGETLAYVQDGEDLASPETQARFAQIVHKLKNEASPGCANEAFATLPPEAQHALNSLSSNSFAKVVTP